MPVFKGYKYFNYKSFSPSPFTLARVPHTHATVGRQIFISQQKNTFRGDRFLVLSISYRPLKFNITNSLVANRHTIHFERLPTLEASFTSDDCTLTSENPDLTLVDRKSGNVAILSVCSYYVTNCY